MKSRVFTKIISAFLVVTVLLVAAPFCEMTDLFSLKVSAETFSGSCGATDQDNVSWSFDSETGVLDITGEGEMADFLLLSSVPWCTYSESIKKVNIANGVKSIGKDAFSGSALESVTISESVTRIGDWAFYSCESLTSVIIPDSVISIGEWAFHSCTKLTTVNFSDNLESMGDGAFAYCGSLESVEIPESVTDIGHFSFYGCISVAEFVVDSDNENYASDNYGVLYNKDKTKLIQYPMGNGRESFTIPDSVRYIDDDAFDSCANLITIVIPDSVESIGDGAFGYCTSLESVTIPDGVTSIGSWVFSECTSLKTITIPDSVTSIGNYAFAACENLTSITIPGSVTEIGSFAFEGCESLEKVYFSGTKEEWDNLSLGTNNESFSGATVKFDKNFCEHDYKAVVTPPTCTEQGYTTYACPLCDDSYIDDNIVASGHDWGNWQVLIEPTESEEGTEQRKCEVCGETETRAVPSTGIFVSLTDFSGEIKGTKILAGEATEVTFENLAEGEYTVTVSKETYATRKYTVTVVDGKATCGFKLNRIGDINGDGKISVVDYTQLLRHVKKTASLDGYAFDCADVNGDGKLSLLDYTKLLRHVKKTEKLW